MVGWFPGDFYHWIYVDLGFICGLECLIGMIQKAFRQRHCDWFCLCWATMSSRFRVLRVCVWLLCRLGLNVIVIVDAKLILFWKQSDLMTDKFVLCYTKDRASGFLLSESAVMILEVRFALWFRVRKAGLATNSEIDTVRLSEFDTTFFCT